MKVSTLLSREKLTEILQNYQFPYYMTINKNLIS